MSSKKKDKETKEPKKNGRPTKYSTELAINICKRVSTTSLGLVSICKEFDVDYSTMKDWLIKYPDFAAKYERAKEEQADHLADEMIAIADDATEDFKTRKNLDGEDEEYVDHEHIQRSRLRVDTRKFIAAKLKPKKYGRTLDITSNGQPLSPNFSGFTKEELLKLAKEGKGD